MAQTITDIQDTGANNYTADPYICREDIDGNLFITIDGYTADTNIDAFLNHPAFIAGVDNMDGTYTFEMNPDLLDSEECITTYEETPTPCIDECPEVSFRQGNPNEDGDVVAVISINHDDLASVDVNGNIYTTNYIIETTTPTGSCVIYDLIITSNTGCSWTFTITLPACEWYGAFDDCANHNECVTLNPSFTWSCNETTGTVTVTPDYDGGSVISETFEWSTDGVNWTTFVTSFTPDAVTGYIRWTLNLDDNCEDIEIIDTFTCGVDCENSSECACTYDAGLDEFVINCTDSFLSATSSDTTVYYVDGSPIPVPYTLGAVISGAGITRIDWERTIEFSDSCPDLVLTGSCSKIDECDYTGYELTCNFDNDLMTATPTFAGDTTILDTDIKEYSINGAPFGSYIGGGILTSLFVVFKWTIGIEGCDTETLVTSCGHCDKCDDINVTINNGQDLNVNITNDCLPVGECEPHLIACQEVCFRSDSGGVTVVKEIELADGTLLSTVPAFFTFPYASCYSTLKIALNAYLAVNGGGWADIECSGGLSEACIQIYDSYINFDNVIYNRGSADEKAFFFPCERCDYEVCHTHEADTTITDVRSWGGLTMSTETGFAFPYNDDAAGWASLCTHLQTWLDTHDSGAVVECEADVCAGVGSYRLTISNSAIYWRDVVLAGVGAGNEAFTRTNCVTV